MSKQMQSEIAELSNEIDHMDDPRRCLGIIRERIRACKQRGSAVPPEMSRMERMLEAECLAESQGR